MGTFLHSNGRSSYSSMQCTKEEKEAATTTKPKKNPFNNVQGSVEDLSPDQQITYYTHLIDKGLVNGAEKRHYVRKLAELGVDMRLGGLSF